MEDVAETKSNGFGAVHFIVMSTRAKCINFSSHIVQWAFENITPHKNV